MAEPSNPVPLYPNPGAHRGFHGGITGQPHPSAFGWVPNLLALSFLFAFNLCVLPRPPPGPTKLRFAGEPIGRCWRPITKG